MKFFIHYKNPDPNQPFYGVYDIYVKRWWFSRKKPIVLNKEMEGGLGVAINCVVKPYINQFHTCVVSSGTHPDERETLL